MTRTLIIDTLNKISQEVKLFGWVENYRVLGKITFIELRDRTGKVQCVAMNSMKDLTIESVVEIIGIVKQRPESQAINEETGKIEIEVIDYKILNRAEALPIPVKGNGYDIKEEMRIRYRYLDLRRNRMHKILKIRSSLIKSLRDSLYDKDFVEVETPMLTMSTKEGARDFVVPSRMNPGKFYALPQSPQQYKQLLMTAGVERYFQVAKCIRDENLRADRGFEFTQLDLEMSFVQMEDVMKTVEDIVKKAVKENGGKLRQQDGENFPRIDYKDAIEKYGADKFDMRSEKEKKEGVLAFAWVINFPFFKKVDIDDVAEVRDGKSGWTFTHNPFSTPTEDYLQDHLKMENIENIVTAQYDLVCNGYEIGGGSIRAHNPEVLKTTFKIMGYTDEQIEESVGHMLEAFRLGTPPHGGIALGVDRLVMLLAGEESLKETIAFPMTNKGITSVMQAPSEVSEEQLQELGLKIVKGKDITEEIKLILDRNKLEYKFIEHEETLTSEDSANSRGTKLEEGAKALIMRGKKTNKNYMFVIPADKRIDTKKAAEKVGEALEFEKPEIILEKYNLEVGGVPPFGNILNIPTFIDERLASKENISFNAGKKTCSVTMNSKDLLKVIEAEEGNWIKED